jgi:hypothetical protein
MNSTTASTKTLRMAAPFSLVPLVGSPEAPVLVSSLNFHVIVVR